MTLLSTFAQAFSQNEQLFTSSQLTDADVAAVIAVMAAVLMFSLFLGVITYIISAIFLGKIFKKAGVEGYIAWIPFYNTWKLLEIGGQPGYWAVLAIIPFVNYASAVFMYIAMYHIGLKLGKSGAFVVLAIFLPLVWLIWLAIDESKWHDAASSKPSLHHNTAPQPQDPSAHIAHADQAHATHPHVTHKK